MKSGSTAANNIHPQINWRSRIVKSGKIKASQITPHPNNPRRHPQIQRDAVAASFNELGQIARIVININNGYLVDGEERSWLALAQNGDVELDVDYVDLTEDEHLKALTYFDAITNLANYDAQTLDMLLHEVNSDSPAIQQMLSELAERENVPSVDVNGLWQGMPEFEHDDLTNEAAFIIRVFLKDADDLASFGELLGKDLTDKKFVWFSKQPMGKVHEVHDESQS